MKKNTSRTPRNYDGTQITSHKIGDILPAVLSRINEVYKDRPDLILAAWPEVIGPKLAAMTQAVSFIDGVLTVKVKNSTLHSLLSRHEKFRMMSAIQRRFPNILIQNIVFRIA